MHYDPIKETLIKFFNRWPGTRRLFYHLLDILLLRTWYIHKALRVFFKEKGNQKIIEVLDAGSGFGQYTYFLARKKPKWVIKGVDVKTEEIYSCNTFFSRIGIHNASFEEKDLVNYSSPNSYDLILSVDVMEHIQEDVLVLSNFFRSLRKDGLLLISTPSNLGGSGVKDEGDSSFIEEHVRDGYSMDELKEKLKKAGFEKIDIQYTYGRPGSISWHLSMKYPILLLGMSKLFLMFLPIYYLFVMPISLILNAVDVRLKHKSGTGLLVKAWK
jgi:2-polyprenyl-3-methyl-5-hydroxy-6-metoxy-1,4-benzoquinol methylase